VIAPLFLYKNKKFFKKVLTNICHYAIIIMSKGARPHKQEEDEIMKIKELMKMLAKMDGEAEIRFRDTYWENEGYGSRAEDPRALTHGITHVTVCDMKDGTKAVVLQ
jgi:hypothetical protein